LQQFVPAWKDITDDPEVLDWVEHCHLEFIDGVPPVQETDYKVIQFNDAEAAIIESEIVQLLNKGVIVESPHSQGEFVSSIFVRLKKNGVDYRMILNLKELNKFIVYRLFKMDSLKTVTDLMSQGCYMASVDIKDAYYTVPIATEHQKFLKFRWRDKLYQYTCLPNGLASAQSIFTKLLKPVFNIMRQKGYLSSSYIDDCYLQGATYGECHDNVQETLMLLGDLGFPIHNEKSVLIPSQVLTFLGFVLNSVTMTVQLTKSRKQKLKTACLTLVNKEPCTIQSVAEVIGVIVSSFPGVEHGPLHYRSLERDKSHALRENKGNFGSSMILSPSSRAELNWWISNVDTSLKLISHGEPELHIQTDASALGWGGLRGEQRTGGRWTQQEASHHINYLELLAVFLTIKALCGNCANLHIRVQCDNTTAVCYINNMGGSKSPDCNSVARQIWDYCVERHIWISASHLPGCENTEADRESRHFNDRTEWQLASDVYYSITGQFGQPSIDLFASRLNKQCPVYASWRPDPDAMFVDAFSANWNNFFFYAFPPFSLIGKCLEKIQANRAEGILVVPCWTCQSWYPKLLRLLIAPPLMITHREALLTLPGSQKLHPLRKKLNLLACHLCGDSTRTEAFLREQPTLFSNPGANHHRNSMMHTSENGFSSVLKGKQILFVQL